MGYISYLCSFVKIKINILDYRLCKLIIISIKKKIQIICGAKQILRIKVDKLVHRVLMRMIYIYIYFCF
jgi:hypothetical protein